MYVDRSAAFRQSDQLFVCFGGCNKGRAVSKQRLSHWIVDAVALAYEYQGKDCPLNIKLIRRGRLHLRGPGLEVCLYRTCVLLLAGLLRTHSPGFISWIYPL